VDRAEASGGSIFAKKKPVNPSFTKLRDAGAMSRRRAFHEAPLPLFTVDADEAIGVPLGSERLPSYIQDHRKRLRARFMEGGAAAMPDYEMLELVLFRAIPRQDVKPLARRLLDVFGDFNRVLSAPAARLTEVQGVGDAVVQELKIVEAAAHRAGAGKGDEPAGPVVVGRAARLLSHLDGASRDRAVPGALSWTARTC